MITKIRDFETGLEMCMYFQCTNCFNNNTS